MLQGSMWFMEPVGCGASLWSGWAGSWFGNAERRDSGPRVILARATGGALILTAVILALQSGRPE